MSTATVESGLGMVTRHLLELLARQVQDQKVVVWYDPAGEYGAIADLLASGAQEAAALFPTGTRFLRDEGSLYALRYAVEPLIAGLDAPRLLVYVPRDRSAIEEALAELESLGVVARPGQQPPARNTRLAVAARNALKGALGEENAFSLEKQVEAGKLTLAELDALAHRGEALGQGVVTVIYEGKSEPRDLALAFLTEPDRDELLVERKATAEMSALLAGAFDLAPGPAEESPAALRQRFARHLLVSDLRAALEAGGGAVPVQLSAAPQAEGAILAGLCADLAATFRLRRDLAESYEKLAGSVEAELNIPSLPIDRRAGAAEVETFAAVERKLQESVESALTSPPAGETVEGLVEYARRRQGGFWSTRRPEIQARWSLIAAAGSVLQAADRIEGALAAVTRAGSGTGSAAAAGEQAARLLDHYTSPEEPWCMLDTHHRHMERWWHNFEFDIEGTTHQMLERLVARARQRYMEVGGALAEAFTRAYHRSRTMRGGAQVPPPLSLVQREMFELRVRPHLNQGKVAYVLVDALRYEMARELSLSLREDFEVTLEAAVGTAPTITEIGMAALMPGAQAAGTAVIRGVEDGKVALQVGERRLGNRKERMAFLMEELRARFQVEGFENRLEALLPQPSPALRSKLRGVGFIVITSQEIDALCEGDNIPLARRTMDDMLHQLRRAFRILGDLGVTRIICAADHGYLFADELGEDMKIDPPGGETVDLHRRVWVGLGGASGPGYFRARLSDFGLGGDLEIAAPWNFAGFRTQGASAYFHGGLSPQELVIPALTLVPIAAAGAAPAPSSVAWEIKPGSSRITTRFVSASVIGTASGLFPPAPPRVRLEVRAANGAVLSMPVSATYGFDEVTGDVQLRASEAPSSTSTEPDTITMMLREPVDGSTKLEDIRTAVICLRDASTGIELARSAPIGVEISL